VRIEIITAFTVKITVVWNVAPCSLVNLKLNGTHHLLAYADDINILGGSLHTVKENADALVVATKEIGLEVNADKIKYMIMSRHQNAG